MEVTAEESRLQAILDRCSLPKLKEEVEKKAFIRGIHDPEGKSTVYRKGILILLILTHRAYRGNGKLSGLFCNKSLHGLAGRHFDLFCDVSFHFHYVRRYNVVFSRRKLTKYM